MSKMMDMAKYYKVVKYYCCFKDHVSTERQNIIGQITYLNMVLPQEIQIRNGEEKDFIDFYKAYRTFLLEKYMDDQFLFSAHYKSYRKIKRNKQYTLAPFEEIYGGFSDYTLFFFQTLYDFYHEQFYSNPYYIEGLNRRLLKRIYIGCLTALCSTKLVPQYELDGVMDEFNNSLAE